MNWKMYSGARRKTTKKGDMNEVLEVFEFWRDLHSNGRSRLDEKRRRAITARLRDGYTVDDLKLAVLGCKFSPFHNGENDRQTAYKSIELICRDADHVDRFIDLAEREASRIKTKQTPDADGVLPMSEAQARIKALLARFKPAEAH